MANEDNAVVLSYCDSLLRKSDVNLLKGPFWLNDAVIGFYFEYLNQYYETITKKELLFVGPEMTQLLKMTEPSQYDIFLDPIDAANHNFLFFPLNNCDSKDSAGGSHWSLLVCSSIEETCYHFDSLKHLNNYVALNFAKRIATFFLWKHNKYIEIDSPQQKNDYDCGIFALCLTDLVSEHILKTSNIRGWNGNALMEKVHGKRLHLLNLINSLKGTSNNK